MRKLCEPDALVHVGWNDQMPCSVVPPRFSPITLLPPISNRGRYFAPLNNWTTLEDHPSVAGSNSPSCCRMFGSWNSAYPPRRFSSMPDDIVHTWSMVTWSFFRKR